MSAQPVAVIIAATRSQIRHFGPAIERAGYAISFLSNPNDVPASPATAEASLLVYNQDVSHTAILSGYRVLPQRPDLVMLYDDHALPGEGFQPEARIPHTPADLERILRHHLAPPVPIESSTADRPELGEPTPAAIEPEPLPIAEPAPLPAPEPVPAPVAPTLAPIAPAPLPTVEHEPTLVAPAPLSTAEPTPTPIEPVPVAPAPAPVAPAPLPTAEPAPLPAPVAPTPANEPKPAVRLIEPADSATRVGNRTPSVPLQVNTPERHSRGRRLVLGILFVLLFLTAAVIVLNQSSRSRGASQSGTPLTTIEAHTSDGAAAHTDTPTPASSESRASTPPVRTTTPTIDRRVQSVPLVQQTATTAVISASDIDLVAEVIGVVPPQPQANDAINVQVRIHNAGSHPITETFWVDLYVAPQQTPVVNQLWTDISSYGATWQVEGLKANETRVLESLGADPARSNLLYFPHTDAVQVYALVDSYGFDGRGAIQERDEDNNLSLPFEIPVAPGNAEEQAMIRAWQ